MPIEVGTELRAISEERFKEIAFAVTGMAFDLHREFGAMFHERVYQEALAAECRNRGIAVECGARIRLTHADYSRDYYLDLLVECGALFELKACKSLDGAHRAQALNYLFLTGLQRAKLLNFAPGSVQQKFVSTRITAASRRQVDVDTTRWRSTDAESTRFRDLLLELLDDWGAFLQLTIYFDAIVHAFGGHESAIHLVPISRNGRQVSVQTMPLLNPETAFKLTAASGSLEIVERQVRRVLRATPLRTLQWVNLHHHEITFVTLTNEG